MRVFLTGNHNIEWRWEISDFLNQQQIDVIDSAATSLEPSSIFKHFKILEGCDFLIAYFSGLQQRHLHSMLEISYASKLAKEVMIVDDIPRRKNWASRLPYSMIFSNLDGVKKYFSQKLLAPHSQPRLFG